MDWGLIRVCPDLSQGSEGGDDFPALFPVWEVFDQGAFHSSVIGPRPYDDDDWDPVFSLENVRVYEVEACEGDAREKDRDGFPSFE